RARAELHVAEPTLVHRQLRDSDLYVSRREPLVRLPDGLLQHVLRTDLPVQRRLVKRPSRPGAPPPGRLGSNHVIVIVVRATPTTSPVIQCRNWTATS